MAHCAVPAIVAAGVSPPGKSHADFQFVLVRAIGLGSRPGRRPGSTAGGRPRRQARRHGRYGAARLTFLLPLFKTVALILDTVELPALALLDFSKAREWLGSCYSLSQRQMTEKLYWKRVMTRHTRQSQPHGK